MRHIVAQAHDYLGLLLDFHWREAIRIDWRADQLVIIDGLIHGSIHALGITNSDWRGGRGESPEPFAARSTNGGRAK